MKKYILLIIFTLIILTGCKSKTSFSLTFDEFTLKFYDNNKQYIAIQSDANIIDIKIITEMKEEVGTGNTGFINSLLVTRTAIQSWLDIQTLVDSNTKNLQLKLLKYKNTDSTNKKVKCNDLQYSWYITAFSYLLDKETLYGWQYFFTDDESLYIVSLSSDTYKDIQSFIKSIGTIKCIN